MGGTKPYIYRRGFTLVELLIVIVVIAILAAISIVAYNGLQQRAEEAKLTAALDSYVKVFESLAVTDEGYPDTGNGCLGLASDYPAEGVFPSGACIIYNGAVDSSYNQNLTDALSPYMSSIPSVKLPPVRVNFSESMVYDYRGIWVESDTYYWQIQYWLKGDRNCPKGTKTYFSDPGATRCTHFWGLFS